MEIRRQEKIFKAEDSEPKRRQLSRKYMAKILYSWNDEKFEAKYLKKLEMNLEEV